MRQTFTVKKYPLIDCNKTERLYAIRFISLHFHDDICALSCSNKFDAAGQHFTRACAAWATICI